MTGNYKKDTVHLQITRDLFCVLEGSRRLCSCADSTLEPSAALASASNCCAQDVAGTAESVITVRREAGGCGWGGGTLCFGGDNFPRYKKLSLRFCGKISECPGVVLNTTCFRIFQPTPGTLKQNLCRGNSGWN